MYEERREKFSFKSFFLTLLLVLLFVFLMLWLFPTRTYVDKQLEELDGAYSLERLSVLYDEIFANNVYRMKDAAIGYFTDERMPQVVGQSKKLTLKEMYDLHLVLKMKDKDGKPCSTTKSYVEMTKYTEEYRLKVNLSCGKQEDYIIVYLGCYHYCKDGICEKTSYKPNPTTANEIRKQNDDKKEPEKPTPEIIKNYLYEYKLVTNDSKSCTPWSSWTKNKIVATDTVEVETKLVNEQTGTKTVSIPVTKKETVKKDVVERYISDYITELVLVGTKKVQVDTTTKTTTKEVQVGTIEKATGKIITGTSAQKPVDTAKLHYKELSTDTRKACSYCEDETWYTWEEYSVEPVYDVVETKETVPVYKEIKQYETKQVPVYGVRTVQKEEIVEKTVYETKVVPVYSNVTYYRSKTCKVIKGTTDIKWSKYRIDTDLIGKGYKFTGNVKEA